MHLQVDTTHLLKFKRRFKNGNILINFLHLKFGSVNYLIERIFLAALSKMFVWKMFYYLLSKHLWRKIFLVKFRAFCTFFLIALNECIWSIKTLLWETSYFRHSINIQEAAWNYKSLNAKTTSRILWNARQMKTASAPSVIKSKKQCFQLFFDQTATLVLRARNFSPEKLGGVT